MHEQNHIFHTAINQRTVTALDDYKAVKQVIQSPWLLLVLSCLQAMANVASLTGRAPKLSCVEWNNFKNPVVCKKFTQRWDY